MTLRKLFLISLFGCSSSASVLASECSSLLQDGVFNHYSFNSNSNTQAEVHNTLCDSTKEIVDTSKSGSSGGSFGLNIGSDKLSIGSSRESAKAFKNVYESQICTAENRELTYSNEEILQQSVVDKNIVDAFVDCKKLEENGVIVDVTQNIYNEAIISIDITFIGDPDGETIGGYQVVPNNAATCNDTNFKPGPIEVDTYYLNCVRNSNYNSGYAIRIHTSEGNYTHNQPATPGTPMLSLLESEVASLRAKVGDWPEGQYCIFQGGGVCPGGFTASEGSLRAIRQYSAGGGYIKAAKFGDSSIKCHGGCGQYGPYGEINLKVCCK